MKKIEKNGNIPLFNCTSPLCLPLGFADRFGEGSTNDEWRRRLHGSNLQPRILPVKYYI